MLSGPLKQLLKHINNSGESSSCHRNSKTTRKRQFHILDAEKGTLPDEANIDIIKNVGLLPFFLHVSNGLCYRVFEVRIAKNLQSVYKGVQVG